MQNHAEIFCCFSWARSSIRATLTNIELKAGPPLIFCKISSSHMESVHMKIKRFYCDHCPKAFYYRRKLAIHLKSHFNISDIPCNQCDLLFRTTSNLIDHRKRVHENYKKPQVPVPCEICGKILASRQNHKLHYRTVHLKEKPFVCDVPGCDRRFPNITELKRHKCGCENKREMEGKESKEATSKRAPKGPNK